MPLEKAYKRLDGRVNGLVRRSEPLSRHTTYRIGGPAALFIEADTLGDMARVFEVLTEEEVAWVVLGKGSNVLASDAGYEGAVVVLGRDFKRHSVDGTLMKAGAGVSFAAVVRDAFAQGMSGLEFAVGIPGTLGGAIAMNAGSHDEWIGSVVESATVYEPGAGLSALRGSEVRWGYRRTSIPGSAIIVESALRLKNGDSTRIRQAMEARLRRRKAGQPLDMPSAGSVFINPEGDSAGRLIEAAGLKGAGVGGARVSERHANFIVNAGGATAADVVELMSRVRAVVRDLHGIELTPEIRFLGSFETPTPGRDRGERDAAGQIQ